MLAPIGDYGLAVENFRKKYSDIDILKGIEFGYSAAACPEYLAVQKKYNFDYVINSVHTISKRGDCYFPRFFEGKTVIQAYSDYFDAVLESVSAPYDYEIIGHIGYVSRYCRAENPAFYKNYKTVIDDILNAIIKRDKCLEINTSVGGSGSSFLPDKDIIERYLELGGQQVFVRQRFAPVGAVHVP